jgi:hypothetical protein
MTGGRIASGVEGFAARYPRVWHVMEAEGAGYDTLYPAATLRRLGGLAADSANRDDFQRVDLPDGTVAILRKQLMRDERLRPTLAGGFTGQTDRWREHINQHVFFWISRDRRDRFIAACVRLRAEGTVGPGAVPIAIEFGTAALLAAHHEAAFFSLINAGSTIRGGARTRRDETTLRPVHSWAGEQAVELAIRGAVPRRPNAQVAMAPGIQ